VTIHSLRIVVLNVQFTVLPPPLLSCTYILGKSTLLRIIFGMESASSGSAAYGGRNVVAQYFAQSTADLLDPHKTVWQTILDESTEVVARGTAKQQSTTELRALLAAFLFSEKSILTRVRELSGGEKSRLALCRMMLHPANLLLLDEVRVYTRVQ
jgi:ATP-binding cassette subfamily F protein 3